MTREEIIANCKIKTKEQFIQECKKNGIEDDWYNFSEEHTRPVSIGNEHVTYGIVGRTNCAFPETRWDEAMEHLLKYKRFVEWERSGSPLKIEDVEFKTKYFVQEFRDGYATLCTVSQTNEPDQELLDEGWIYENYDWYQGVCNYYKKVRYEELDAPIQISFIKRTEERDKKEFGFTEPSLRGSFRYPVPKKFRDEIFRDLEKEKTLSEAIKEKLAKHFEKTLIDDEFNAFVDLKNTVPKVMLKAIDSTQSNTKEQKDAMFQAARIVKNNNPAYDNFYGSRSHILSDLIYASVLKTVGIAYDHKTNEWVKTI